MHRALPTRALPSTSWQWQPRPVTASGSITRAILLALAFVSLSGSLLREKHLCSPRNLPPCLLPICPKVSLWGSAFVPASAICSSRCHRACPAESREQSRGSWRPAASWHTRAFSSVRAPSRRFSLSAKHLRSSLYKMCCCSLVCLTKRQRAVISQEAGILSVCPSFRPAVSGLAQSFVGLFVETFDSWSQFSGQAFLYCFCLCSGFSGGWGGLLPPRCFMGSSILPVLSWSPKSWACGQVTANRNQGCK